MAAAAAQSTGDRFWRGLALLAAYGLPFFFILAPLGAFLIYSLFSVQGVEINFHRGHLQARPLADPGALP
jgi:ABC-type Fe3+ transport system permease subunit